MMDSFTDIGVFERHHELRLVAESYGLVSYCPCGWVADRSSSAKGAVSDWCQHMNEIERELTGGEAPGG